MDDIDRILQKVKEARDYIAETKSGGLNFRDSPEFKTWWDSTYKWLKKGADLTSNESISFANLDFTGKTSHFHHDPKNELKNYQEACDKARIYLKSAIENIENNLADRRSVHIQSSGKVIIGDHSIIKFVQSISIGEILEALENEIEAKVSDPGEKKSLQEKIKGIFQSPLSNSVLNQSLSEFLKKYFS
ncbi:MAG: hypothetical protein HY200_05160 [Nitrospirae bacterium]|nr:hypothetical protein [Nitrospirota bacterium]MBI3594328.1 hypothetical protein [Nitrospirota bacterium]